MFSIKLAYKDKNILLGKGLNSMESIQEEFKKRFPDMNMSNGILLKYQGRVLNSYEEIQEIANKLTGKAVKLEVELAPPKNSQIKKFHDQNQQLLIESKMKEKEFSEQVDQNIEKKIQEKEEMKQEQAEKKQIQKQLKSEQVPSPKQQNEAKLQKKSEGSQQVHQIKEQKSDIQEQWHSVQEQKHELPQIIDLQESNNKTDMEESDQKDDIPFYQSEIKNNQEGTQKTVEENKLHWIEEVDEEKHYSHLSNQLKLEERSSQSNVLKQLESGVYECVFCQDLQYCNVCKSERKITKDSKFFQIVNKIVDEKLEKLEKVLIEKVQMLLINSQQEKKSEKMQKISQIAKSSLVQQKKMSKYTPAQKQIILDNIYLIRDDLAGNKSEISVGQQFIWTFQVEAVKQLLPKSQKVSIIDEKTNQISQILLLYNNTQIKVGPFIAQNEGRFVKNYRMCLVEQDGSIQLFGPKFGLNIIVTKQKPKRILNNMYRLYIEHIKKQRKILRDTQYLIEKLKQIGINQENYEQIKDMIPDICSTV